MNRYIALICLALGLGGCGSVFTTSTPTASPTPIGPRQIVENTLNLREYWRVSGQPCFGSYPDMDLVIGAASGRVICRYFTPEDNGVRAYSASSGDLVWQASTPLGINTLAVDARRVYAKMQARISVYDLNTGKQMWTKRVASRATHHLNPDGDKVHVLERASGKPEKLLTFVADTGELLNSEIVLFADDYVLLGRYTQFDLYFNMVTDRLRATDPATGQARWETSYPRIPGWIHWPVVLLDDILLLDPGGEVTALDASSGQVRWQRDYYSSLTAFAARPVLIDNFLYIFQYDGCVVKLDAKTGQALGHVRFAPNLSSGQGKFGFAADGEMMFVLFSDSGELIALGP